MVYTPGVQTSDDTPDEPGAGQPDVLDDGDGVEGVGGDGLASGSSSASG